MANTRFFAYSLLLLIFSGLTYADQAAETTPVEAELSQHIDLPTLIQLAYERNPRIKAARTEWQATIEKFPQMTSLPDPMLMYGYFLRNVETRVGPQRHRLGISQSFPYPGTLKAAGEVNQKQVEIQEKKYEQTVRDVIVGVKLAYYELTYLEQAIQIVTQNQELMDHVVKVVTMRYAENKATFSDLMKAQSQQAQLAYDAVLLYELREVEQASIRAFLDLPPDTPLGLPVPVPYKALDIPLDRLNQRALAGRQELQLMDLMSQKAEKAIHLAKMKNKPMFKLDLMTVETGESMMLNTKDSGKDPWIISLGVSLPLWGSKNRSRVKEAQLNQQSIEENRQWMGAKLIADMKKIYFRDGFLSR